MSGRLGITIALICLFLSGACTRNRQIETEQTPIAPTTIPQRTDDIVMGQTIYVPAYSHVYYKDRRGVINLTTTLSVRNADPTHAIWIDSVHYYDATGQLLRNELEQPQQLAPLASLEFLVEEEDTSGDSGTSFLVKWSSSAQTVAPVIETVMISAASTQGISFVTTGRVIEEFSVTPPAGNTQ